MKKANRRVHSSTHVHTGTFEVLRAECAVLCCSVLVIHARRLPANYCCSSKTCKCQEPRRHAPPPLEATLGSSMASHSIHYIH